jgi:dolichol-phosphate mannosyltransferase
VDLTIVIPCYNEVGNVPKIQREFFPVVVHMAQQQSVEVVFVDDGSTDGTEQALQEDLGDSAVSGVLVRFERHDENRGLGAALRTGFAAAQGDVIVTTDSDGTYRFSEIPALLAQLRPEVDIVTASPHHPDGKVVDVPPYRLVLSRGSAAIYRLLVDWRVHTYTSLFRTYRRQVTDHVSFESDGFLAGTELMVKGMLAGYRVAEYPTALHVRAFGASKAKIVRTIWEHLKFQFRVLFHRLNVAPIVEPRRAKGVQA